MDPQFQHLVDLITKALELEQALHDMVTLFRQRIELEKEIESIRKLLVAFASRYEAQRSELRALLDEINGLIKEISASGGEPPATVVKPVRPTEFADQFLNLFDTIQQKARQPGEGETATTLKNIEIELKGLVVVEENEAKIVPPEPGSSVDPGLLSTVRLSFGAIPVLRPQQREAPPPSITPAPPAPTPTSPTIPVPKPVSKPNTPTRKQQRGKGSK